MPQTSSGASPSRARSGSPSRPAVSTRHSASSSCDGHREHVVDLVGGVEARYLLGARVLAPGAVYWAAAGAGLDAHTRRRGAVGLDAPPRSRPALLLEPRAGADARPGADDAVPHHRARARARRRRAAPRARRRLLRRAAAVAEHGIGADDGAVGDLTAIAREHRRLEPRAVGERRAGAEREALLPQPLSDGGLDRAVEDVAASPRGSARASRCRASSPGPRTRTGRLPIRLGNTSRSNEAGRPGSMRSSTLALQHVGAGVDQVACRSPRASASQERLDCAVVLGPHQPIGGGILDRDQRDRRHGAAAPRGSAAAR